MNFKYFIPVALGADAMVALEVERPLSSMFIRVSAPISGLSSPALSSRK